MSGNGTYTTSIQHRLDGETYISGVQNGAYVSATKLEDNWTVINTATAFIMPSNLLSTWLSYEFQVDQGTAANPVVLIFTSDTSQTVTLSLVAGQTVYWDGSQDGSPNAGAQPSPGIFGGHFSTTVYTAFGTKVASATYTIPTALGVTAVNLTGRITYSS